MGGEWASARISDIANVTDYVANGSFESLRNNVTYRSEPDYAILVRLTDHNAGWGGNFVYVDKSTYDFLSKSALVPGDIVIANVGANAGFVFRVPELGMHMTLGPNAVLCRPRNEEELRRDFLYYYLTSNSGQESLCSILSGSAQPKFNKTDLRRLFIPIPPLLEQRAIAHILGTLDDKIELNRRMNETLEAMARALFKSWFVDFDPVRAKVEGRDTGLPKDLADLFPDSFEDSELGEIPKGWTIAPLPNVIDVNPSRPLRKGSLSPYLDMANMPIRGHTPDTVVDRPFGSGMRFMNGDTLVARITPCLENGKTAYVDFLEEGQVGWGSTEYIVLSPKHPIPPEFAYCLARSTEFREFAIQSMTGSSGRQRVPAESLSHFQVVVAPDTIAKMFGNAIAPLFTRVSIAADESRALAALRDTLLPKLISGDLRIKDAERFVERAI